MKENGEGQVSLCSRWSRDQLGRRTRWTAAAVSRRGGWIDWVETGQCPRERLDRQEGSAKDLLGPMAGDGGGKISRNPKVIAMGFALALISFPKFTEVEERSGGKAGSVVGWNASSR
jgi:hypothetical protein